jgi:hypothetical protein
MNNYHLWILLCLWSQFTFGQINHIYESNQSMDYQTLIDAYQYLSDNFPRAQLRTEGNSDLGLPIYSFIIDYDANFKANSKENKEKAVLLINNGIHAGEPCGIDASLKFAEELLTLEVYEKYLKNTVVCIIPAYNIGGIMNRSCCSRVGQNGPELYGFRGNAKNLDLNRDFIKTDSQNMRVFAKIFHTWDPDIFIDTHTTNGSDHQYTMTLLATQKDKLQPPLRDLLEHKVLPELYSAMDAKNMEMVPYVNCIGKTPLSGIKDYLETPRYSTGYAALFNTIGFVTEALKYKPYNDRVKHTLGFEHSTLAWMSLNKSLLLKTRQVAKKQVINNEEFTLNWELDTHQHKMIDFKGYESTYRKSAYGRNDSSLVYKSNKPFTQKISYYNSYKARTVINKPRTYIIPQSASEVIALLKVNNVKFDQLIEDTTLWVDAYRIKDYKSTNKPYEGHYLHYDIKIEKDSLYKKFYKGDIMVPTNQSGNRYIIETFEPQAHDSYFAWNFFDYVLQQKEWFSPFSFEPIATRVLKNNPKLADQIAKMKTEDFDFANDRAKQLRFIYEHSDFYEDTHNLYPIFRLN